MRPSTWLLVAAVGAIGLLAAIDGLRSSGPATETGPPATTSALDESGALAGELGRAGASGVLLVSDEDCHVRRLVLPAANLETRPETSCDFSVTPDGQRLLIDGTIVWTQQSGRQLGARCIDDVVDVVAPAGFSLNEFRPACAPAWRPDGTLAFVSGDDVVVARPGCENRRCRRVVLTSDDLETAARAASSRFRHFSASTPREIAWLGNTRLAVVLSADVREQPGSRLDLLALYEGKRLIAEPLVNLTFSGLQASPSGRYLTVRGTSQGGLFFFDREGAILAVDPIPGGRTVEWSPDERWTAVVAPAGIYIFRTAAAIGFNTPVRPKTIRIPLFVNDLQWR